MAVDFTNKTTGEECPSIAYRNSDTVATFLPTGHPFQWGTYDTIVLSPELAQQLREASEKWTGHLNQWRGDTPEEFMPEKYFSYKKLVEFFGKVEAGHEIYWSW